MRAGKSLTVLAACGLLIAAITVASAQQRPAARPATPAPQAPAQPPPEPPAPPYEAPMLRLAEIMGAMSFLEKLCGESDGTEWRDRTQGLIEAEDPHPARRERLAGAFNRGFSGYQDTYRTCTPSAIATMEKFRTEGAALAADMASRYGG
ncbi:MAG: TIGR02301 family protein [Beijerinckiaceae bacterium]